MRVRGRLTDWDDERGFGYIKPLDGGASVFVHISAFPHDRRRPLVTDLLAYDTRADERGRPRAVNVEFVSGARTRARPNQPSRSVTSSKKAPSGTVLVTAGGFIVLTGALAVLGVIPWYFPVAYSVMSVLTFLIYGADKDAAQNGEWRTGEGTLIAMGLLGGWPGALVAQQFFHHKTRKQPFRMVFFLSIAANVAALVWIVTLAFETRLQ